MPRESHMEMTRNSNQHQSFSQKTIHFQLENVDVCYSKTVALSQISLVINKSEILFVTGPSGAGKSTLLKILAGRLKQTRGKVKENMSLSGQFSAEVFQDLKLVENMSVKDNLFFTYNKSLYKTKKNYESYRDDLLSVLGIQDKLEQKISQLNRGAKQKVAIVRALLTKPDVFIADEPTSALDKENSLKVFELLNYMNTKQGMTIIWATHDKELVRQFPGKIIHLDKGKLIHSGNTCFI